MKKFNIVIVGATGNVGREILNILDARNFPIVIFLHLHLQNLKVKKLLMEMIKKSYLRI